MTSISDKQMRFWARMGHPCGTPFYSEPFLAAHPDWQWESGILTDMPSHPWTIVEAAHK